MFFEQVESLRRARADNHTASIAVKPVDNARAVSFEPDGCVAAKEICDREFVVESAFAVG